MCGIVGIVGKSNVNQALYDGLTVLQHRGQDAAGIVTSHDGRLFLRKDNGLVRDVFQQRHMQRLVGHAWASAMRFTQPLAAQLRRSSAVLRQLAVRHHPGAQRQPDQRRAVAKEIYESDLRHVNTNSDSEVLLNVFAHEWLSAANAADRRGRVRRRD